MRRAAVGETVSHLRALEIDGVVQVEDGEPALWSLTEQGGRADPQRPRGATPTTARRTSVPAATPLRATRLSRVGLRPAAAHTTAWISGASVDRLGQRERSRPPRPRGKHRLERPHQKRAARSHLLA